MVREDLGTRKLDASSGHRNAPGYDKTTFGFEVTISLRE